MLKNLTRVLFVGLVCGAFITTMYGQEDRSSIRAITGSKYVISAKAGGVNLVHGEVRVERKDSTSGYLVKGDTLKAGDRLISSSNARSEILLNPGSYARLGANTEFEFVTTNLNNLAVKLNRGSAIFEVYANRDFVISVITPSTRFYLIKSGVYRVDVSADGTSRLEVHRGRAQVGNLNATILKKGRSVVVRGGSVEVARFNRKDQDSFETWSRYRSKTLAQANADLRRSSAVRNSIWRDYVRGGDLYGNTFGVWTYSSIFGGYCYLPFRNRRTPYGFGLNRNFGSYGYSVVIQQPRRNVVSSFNQGSSGNEASGETGRRGVRRGGQSVDPEIIEARRERRGKRLAEGASGEGVIRSRDQRRRANTTRRSNGTRRSTTQRRSSGSRRSTSPRRSSGPSRPVRRSSPPPRRSSPPPRRSSPVRTKASPRNDN